MDYALSLKNGVHISAADLSESAAYRAALKFLLVCPECGEPVHFRQLESPYNTAFFAHYKQHKSAKALHECSLRTLGASLKPASEVIQGIKHGQTVDRFQHDFYKTFHASFGKYSDQLFSYLNYVEHQTLSNRKYSAFINAIQKEFSNSCVSRTEFSRGDTSLAESVSDICLFLKSSYGNWVGNVLHHIAHFVASAYQIEVADSKIGRVPITHDEQSFVFALDISRLNNHKESRLPIQPSEDVLAQISSSLVGYIVLKWRIPSSKIELITTKKLHSEIVRNSAPVDHPITFTSTSSKIDPSILRHISNRNTYAVATAIEAGVKNVQKAASKRWPNSMSTENNLASESTPKSTESINKNDEGQSTKPTYFVASAEGLNSPFRINADSERRVRLLIYEAKRLPPPNSHLETREEILAWSGKKNSIEAYFLAALNEVPHTPARFTDPTLSARLSGWLQLAKTIK